MFFRIFKYSVKNSLRNKFLSFSSVLVLTLLMFFVNILSILENVSISLIDSINSKLTISLYINETYTKTSLEVSDFIEDIKKINSSIWIEYKTKEEILNDLRFKEPDLVSILERNNPLPDTILLSEIPLSEYKELNSLIESRLYLLSNDETQEDYFANYTTQYERVENVTSLLTILHIWINIIILIFVISIAIIIYSIIWNFIYYYRDEIYITQLVWWAKTFIYWPFVLQWIIYSVIAFVFNAIIFTILLKYLNNIFWHLYIFNTSLIFLLFELLIFILIWGLSGFLSSKKYLKTQN